MLRIGINFHAVGPDVSGVGYYTLGMLNALLAADSYNQYIVYTNQPNLVQRYVPAAPNLALRAVEQLKTRVRRIIWEHFRLPRLAVREHLDVLHCPTYICPLFDGGAPYVVTMHDTLALDHPEWCTSANALYYRSFMKATVRKAAALVAVSRRTADDLIRHFPSCAKKVRVVHPGIDPIFNSQAVSARSAEVKARYRLPDRYILFVGNIEPKKNLTGLLQAYRLLVQQGSVCPLVVVGKRRWKSKSVLREMVQQGEVISLDYVPRCDLPFVYQQAGVFAFPSWYEGFGFPPLEAMACGVPVVASNRGALGETLEQAACQVDPANPCDIAMALHRMLSDPAVAKRYRDCGISQSRKFTWEQTARELLDLYAEVAAGPR